MARRSEHSREQLLTLALDAAWGIVETEGAKSLTARRLAQTIGYSPGTLYNLFEDLDELTLRVNARSLEKLYEALAACRLGQDPETDLRALLDAYLTFIERHPRHWDLVMNFNLPEGKELPSWYDDRVTRLLGVIEEAVRPMVPDGDVVRANRVARVLWASVQGICSLANSGKLTVVSSESARELAADLVHTYLAGLKANQGAA